MGNHIRHFEIEADDVERAKKFYETVFGWKIKPWGPPNYYLIDFADGLTGDIRERQSPKGSGNAGFVCTITVDDLQAIEKAIIANGGGIVMPKMRIEGVGDLMYLSTPKATASAAYRPACSGSAPSSQRRCKERAP